MVFEHLQSLHGISIVYLPLQETASAMEGLWWVLNIYNLYTECL